MGLAVQEVTMKPNIAESLSKFKNLKKGKKGEQPKKKSGKGCACGKAKCNCGKY